MQNIYEIYEYKLKGEITLYTYIKHQFEKIEKLEVDGRKIKSFYATMTETNGNKITSKFSYIASLFYYSLSPKGQEYKADGILPYYATVIEDLPDNLKIKPKRYNDCALMMEKHGGYLQFRHIPSGKVLRIAMNSHIYQQESNK